MSDRKMQIEEACHQHKEETPLTAFGFNREEIDLLLSAFREAFISGAEWADANPPAHSGDDERDADAYVTTAKNGRYNPEFTDLQLEYAFLAGRKGMVPAAQAEERFNAGYVEASKKSDVWIAEAVRAERERCAKIVRDLFGPGHGLGDAARSDILNPSEEGKNG